MIIVLVKDGVVEHCIGADEDQMQNVAEMYPDHLILPQMGEENVGWHYDGELFTPPEGYVPEGSVRITQLAFLNRFTDTEAITIDLASMGATVEAASLRRELKRTDAAKYIDLNDPGLIAGLNKLELYGLLGEGRATEILTAQVTAKELYTD
jgi:hypothetical protein